MISLTVASVVKAILSLIVSAIVIWVAQIVVLPKEKEKPFTSVLGLAILWAIVEFIFSLIAGIVGFRIFWSIVTLIVWLLALKSWFNTGWGHAILISIVAFILTIIVGFLLLLLGFVIHI